MALFCLRFPGLDLAPWSSDELVELVDEQDSVTSKKAKKGAGRAIFEERPGSEGSIVAR